jgi:hypothetical protein
MTALPQLGIDPGISNGCFSIRNNGKLINIRMKEEFRDIMEILKPFGGSPTDTDIRCLIERIYINPFSSPKVNANMQRLMTNFERLKDALYACNIPYQVVEAKAWQKFHNLVQKKEKGIDYDALDSLKKDLRHLTTHLKIENNVKNDEVIAGDVKHILETSGKHEARKMLCDGYLFFTKSQLKSAIEETEKEITKFKSKEKQIRKGRYKDYANKVYIKSLIGDDEKRIERITNELKIDVKGFFYNNVAITPAELRKLFKLYKLKPLTLNECDAVLILLYQLNS